MGAGATVGVRDAAHSTASVDETCRREYRQLFGTLRLYVGDPQLAEELAQEALARLIRHWDRVGAMDAPGAWLHRVAINLANSTFRRRAAERRAQERLRSSPVRQAETADSAEVIAVRRAVAQLAPRQREVVILRFFEDLSVRDAALRMGIAEGTVKSVLADAIRALRSAGLEVEGD